MNKAEFIKKWELMIPIVAIKEFEQDLEIIIKQEVMKTHIFVDNGATPEICSECTNRIKSIKKNTSNKKYCPVCNQYYLF